MTSDTLVHPLKPLDGMRCHLAGTLLWSQVFLNRGPGLPTGRGDFGVGTPNSQRCRLSPNYFGPCLKFLSSNCTPAANSTQRHAAKRERSLTIRLDRLSALALSDIKRGRTLAGNVRLWAGKCPFLVCGDCPEIFRTSKRQTPSTELSTDCLIIKFLNTIYSSQQLKHTELNACK